MCIQVGQQSFFHRFPPHRAAFLGIRVSVSKKASFFKHFRRTAILMQRVDSWRNILLLLVTVQILRLRGRVHAYRRMSIAVNSSTVNPHYWYRQPSPALPSWYTYSSTNFRNHKVFHLRFLSQSDVRCNDGTRAGLVIGRLRDAEFYLTVTQISRRADNFLSVPLMSADPADLSK